MCPNKDLLHTGQQTIGFLTKHKKCKTQNKIFSWNFHLFCPYMKVNRVQNNITESKQNKTKLWDIFQKFLLCFTEKVWIYRFYIRVTLGWVNADRIFTFGKTILFNNFFFSKHVKSSKQGVDTTLGSINITSVTQLVYYYRTVAWWHVNVEHWKTIMLVAWAIILWIKWLPVSWR